MRELFAWCARAATPRYSTKTPLYHTIDIFDQCFASSGPTANGFNEDMHWEAHAKTYQCDCHWRVSYSAWSCRTGMHRDGARGAYELPVLDVLLHHQSTIVGGHDTHANLLSI